MTAVGERGSNAADCDLDYFGPYSGPNVSTKVILRSFQVVGLILVPIGVGLLMSSRAVQEYQIDYTFCKSIENEDVTCDYIIKQNMGDFCSCRLFFNLSRPFMKNVFVYYGLTNYHQNHRRYVSSRDDRQLMGHPKAVSTECYPLSYVNMSVPIAPCGAVANSLFNDVIKIYHIESKGNRLLVPLLSTGIALSTDKAVIFRNPQPLDDLKRAFKDTAKPIAWKKPVWQLDPNNSENNGFQNEDFIVWMRTAALPNFRKLYRRVDHRRKYFFLGLPSGRYELEIEYSYLVSWFKGTKKVIVTNLSWLGGKNNFLGWTYIGVGLLWILLGLLVCFN